MDNEILGAILGPLVTAILAILAYVIQEWRTKRRWENERERSVAAAIQEVQYIDTWLSALNRLTTPDPDHELKQHRALADLERSYRVMAFDLADDGPKPRSRTFLEHIGWFLLIPLHNLGAKVVRVFYLITLALALIWVAAIIAVFNADSEAGIGIEIAGSMILTVIGFIPAIGLAVLARFLEHRDRQRRHTPAAAAPEQPWQAGPFQMPAQQPPPPQQWPSQPWPSGSSRQAPPRATDDHPTPHR